MSAYEDRSAAFLPEALGNVICKYRFYDQEDDSSNARLASALKNGHW